MNQQNRVEEINLLDLFDRFKENKNAFIFTCLSFLIAGFFITKYVWPTYTVKSDIQVLMPEVAGEQTSDLIYGASKKSVAEIAIDEAVAIRSFPNMLKAMDSLNFHVSYYVDNIFSDEEIYGSTPFRIELDKKNSSYIPYDEKFNIKPLVYSHYHISGDYENEDTGQEYKIDTIVSANEWVSVKTFRFRVVSESDYTSRPDTAKESLLFAFTDVYELIFEIDEELTITPKDKVSSVLEINLSTTVPNKAIDFVNLMQQLYLKQSVDEKTLLARNSLAYIENELQQVADSLEFAEKELEDYQVENKIANASDEAQRVSEAIDKLEAERADLSVKKQYYNYLQEYFKDSGNSEKLISPAAFGISDMVLNDLTKQLLDLQTQKNSLIKEGKTKNPDYKSICDKIEDLKAVLKNTVDNFNVSNNILLTDVERRLGKANTLISKLPVSDRMMVKIQRNVSLSQELYLLLQQKKSQVETILQASAPSSSIIDPAHLLSVDPKFPLWLVYPIMLFFAILMVMSAILIKDFLGRKAVNKKIVTNYLSMPFIGYTPLQKKINIESIISNPTNQVAESARIILYNAGSLNKVNNKVILLSSAKDGEGKSFLASALSVVSTFAQKRTLLIDADLRKPTLHHAFNLQTSPGLSDYIEGKASLEKIIQKSKINNLEIISSGSNSNNPGALSESKMLATLLEFAKNNYDRIIIDTASIALVADAFYLMSLSDINLIVIKKNCSTIDSLKTIEDAYQSGKIQHSAFIFNGV